MTTEKKTGSEMAERGGDAERALLDRDGLFRTLFENAGDAILLIRDSLFVDCNARAVQMFGGRERGQIVGHSLDEFSPVIQPNGRDSRQLAGEKIAAAVAGEPQLFEWTHMRFDGTFFPAEVNLVSVKLGGGVLLQAIVRDLTERRRTEEALRESERLLKESQAIASLGSYVLDIATGVWRSSDELDRLFGIDKSYERSVAGWAALIHPEDRAMMVDYFTTEVYGLRRMFDKEYRIIRHADRAERWVHGLGKLELDAQGSPLRMHGTIQDITERKRTEAALRESEEEFRLLAEAMPQIVWITRDDGWTLYFNQQWVEYTGLTLEQSYGHGWNTPFHPDDRQRAWDAWQHAVQSEEPYAIECRLRSAAGIYRWWLIRGVPVRNAAGKIRKWFGTCTDIDDIKQTEAVLQQRESYLSAIIENQPGLMWLKDAEGRFLAVNQRFAASCGKRDKSELIGKTDLDVWPVELAVRYMADDQVVMKNGTAIMTEEMIRDKGEMHWFETYKTPVLSAQGNVVGTTGYSHDITERKRAEAEKAGLELRLQQSQKMESVGRLAGGVAHDFNNMLGVILGHAELALAAVAPASPLHERLTEIHQAAKRSADLTQQLLAFARKQTITPKVLDLNTTVAGMCNMLQRLIGENVRLAWKPGADLWPVKVDSSQIDQILANLCVNARDAITNVGMITIETGNAVFDRDYCAGHPAVVPGDYVRLAVSDDGCGMDKKTLEHLFEPFFTTKGTGRGTGLGLATVYGAIAQNNGFIDVRSAPGEGTTFMIYLPRHKGRASQGRTDVAAGAAVRGHETILLVEDEPSILRLTTMMIARQGYTVLAADTPGEAIRLATENAGDIHLLVTDVVMPEMNGRDLAQNLLTLYPHLKCLFMSGYTADVIAHRGVVDDGVCFIQKPFSMNMLAVKIRETLNAGKG